MAERTEITSRLAQRLREERNAKGLSLDALAKLSGVSRSMLSQIERGESSPTVASLWNLTRALNLEFAELLDSEVSEKTSIIEVLRKGQTPLLADERAKCEIRIISPMTSVGDAEVYDITFAEGGCLESEPHKRGSIEHLTVLSGELEVHSDGESEIVNEGDTIRYHADVIHSIRARSTSRIILVVRNA